MSFKIKPEQLGKVTYLKVDDLQGRVIPLFPCYHQDGTWELWLPANDGLQRMRPGKMREGKYFAKAPQSESDVYLAFFDFMCKRAYWEEIVPFIDGIYDDLQNIATSLAKLDLFYREWKKTHFVAERFVTTELEYLFSVCRSLYDLLQECISKMWSRFKFHDPQLGKRKLSRSFRGMILDGNTQMAKEEIMRRYAIPEQMANYYLRQASFFTWLREFRDYISHSGKSFEFVFSTDKGFAVSIDTKPFSSMDIWCESNTQPNKLGSVRSLVAHLIISTFTAVEEFAHLMAQIIIFPPDVAPEYRIFICGAHSANLQNLDAYITGKPWYDEKPQQT